MNRKALFSLFAVLLLTFGVFACSSSSDQTANTAGLNNSTGTYSGGSMPPPGIASGDNNEPTSNSRVGARENVRQATADTSYSGTGQSLLSSSGSQTASSNQVNTSTTSTTTYTAPTTTVTTIETSPAVVEPNTDTTAVVTTPSTETTITTTETTPTMTSSGQEDTTATTTTTTTTDTTTHRRMHKE